ncbi:hypothetical protein SARC_04487 [Sphaeroforma arctica JP610]|uniref:Uncharacterized protein n=1 Tax=Sphaeroforma arctica JP610 TaxID=667725 RepID=A0A0L0G2F1_9EUKA|nr:hypothetical protein SARC_04487 [Sphaeroforma arctica JP610]KNC83250.1 hypothetical protein SARC_04487 [Sphaeroforma arctica JP610]|eukprot:XP_014157152.1 hypothetical protein SARC_04487 [Sphaeroforma arctica JP610]
MGQTKYLAPAVMYELEIEPVYNLGIQSLLSIGGAGAGTYATPEEACINTFREAYRAQQALLYVPNINRWWEWATPVLKQVFMTMLRDAPPASQLFVMATCDEGAQAMPYKCMELFGSHQTVSVAPLNTRDPFVAYFADLKEMAQAPVYLVCLTRIFN